MASRHINNIQRLEREKYDSSLDLEPIQFSLGMNHPPKWLILLIFAQFSTIWENYENHYQLKSKGMWKVCISTPDNVKNTKKPIYPGFPVLTHGSFDSKSFFTSVGEIWCRNNKGIIGAKAHFRFELSTGNSKNDVGNYMNDFVAIKLQKKWKS